jgi:Fis family transcriptional regulator
MKEQLLEDCVRKNLERYFRDLDGSPASHVYQMVLDAVEKPMLEVVLQYAEGNQSRAADMLGMNRNTLRKKLQQFNLI